MIFYMWIFLFHCEVILHSHSHNMTRYDTIHILYSTIPRHPKLRFRALIVMWDSLGASWKILLKCTRPITWSSGMPAAFREAEKVEEAPAFARRRRVCLSPGRRPAASQLHPRRYALEDAKVGMQDHALAAACVHASVAKAKLH